MADKLTQSGGDACGCTKKISMPEKKSSSIRYAPEEVQSRLRDAPIPSEFKQALEGVISDPQLSSFSSKNSFDTGEEGASESAMSSFAMVPQHTEFKARSRNAPQSFFLTEATVNLAEIEHSVPGLKRFEGYPLSTLVTNTYFLEPCFYTPIFWCPAPAKKACSGMYVTYPKGNQGQNLADALIKKMKDCGLNAKLVPPSRKHKCGDKLCCRKREVASNYRQVVLKKNAKIPKHMARIAAMINGTIGPNKKGNSSFCLALANIGDIDRFAANRPNRKSDAYFNPTRLPTAKERVAFNAGTAISDPKGKLYTRSGCELLGHVISESFWGVNCYGKQNVAEVVAHLDAFYEENWIRRAQKIKEGMMLWQKSPKNVEPHNLPLKKENADKMKKFDKQLKG